MKRTLVKKLIATMVAGTMAVSMLAGCGSSGDEKKIRQRRRTARPATTRLVRIHPATTHPAATTRQMHPVWIRPKHRLSQTLAMTASR